MPGESYQLNKQTIAINSEGESRVSLFIPENAIVTVINRLYREYRDAVSKWVASINELPGSHSVELLQRTEENHESVLRAKEDYQRHLKEHGFGDARTLRPLHGVQLLCFAADRRSIGEGGLQLGGASPASVPPDALL